MAAMARPQAKGEALPSGVPLFEASETFDGARPGRAFKLGHLGLGYYLDVYTSAVDDIRASLPERWRDANFRQESLRVDPQHGAGLSLEYSEFGFTIEKVEPRPGQAFGPGEVIVAIEGRLLAGLSAPQMQASFVKRRIDGARLHVASLEEVKVLSTRDPMVIECWDAAKQHPYFFDKRTGRSAWTREELQSDSSKAAGSGESSETAEPKAPIDLAHFLTHGFAKQKELPKKRKDSEANSANADKKLEADLAREERDRWKDWNSGGRGGYTDMFFDKYSNALNVNDKAAKKADKRLKGSVGPGQGMEYMARWTGSKNSFF